MSKRLEDCANSEELYPFFGDPRQDEEEPKKVCPHCDGEPYEKWIGDKRYTHCRDCGRCLEGVELKDYEED